jgi:hypothetical protein
VLAICRELLRCGLSPDQALEVYRNGILALHVRSIGEGAKLAVRDDGNTGRPRFISQQTRAAAPYIRENGEGA